MNDKLQYASMLEIPVSTCNVTSKKQRKSFFKRKKVNPEAVKEELLNKINGEDQALNQETVQNEQEGYTQLVMDEKELDKSSVEESTLNEDNVESTVNIHPAKKQRKISVIGVQIAVICVLLLTILLTNSLYAQSGINVFFSSVFKSQETSTVDDREYKDFAPVFSAYNGLYVTLSEGIISVGAPGSVYSPCAGEVSNITTLEDGSMAITVVHNKNFKTVFNGVKFAYASVGDKVYKTIPLGYSLETGITMCFMSGDDAIISDYQIIDDSVVWAV